ncbi:uncharacterized protein ACA1_143930 [Acanthamoeba castellanii str. Neff]|uniref:Lipid-binding serum glycoprotein C-terminal domain-containing protein n=1 Tax=Acanthamoeba castellanii (strain ATCC 30010 / Neff) TaxID=1257118 RepID=L8HH33_ACACF|nr:uncharacterized protein ACA1_143930 [Acanthamoeba castellanii str. Neff]ELR24003.1 hypothetical protein ACA1_143930 [Acanthamoeba castellanii str. Neff]
MKAHLGLALLTLLALSTVLPSTAPAELPGVKFTVTQAGLKVFTDGLSIVPQIFHNISSPFVQGSAPAPGVGTVKWTLYSASPMQLVNSTSSTGLQPNTGITLTINTQLVASVGFQYTQLDSPYSSGSGRSLKLNFQGTSIALLLQLGENNQQFTLTTLSAKCNVTSIDVMNAAGPSWLGDIFMKAMRQPLQSAFEAMIAGPTFASTVNQVVDKSLASMPVHQNIWGLLEMDNSFNSPPNVTADHLARGLLPNGTEVPVFRLPMPDTVNDMVQILISDSNAPLWLAVMMKTDFWIPFVPALGSFPDCDLIAQVAANSPPMVSFQKEGIQLQITAEILISVVYGGAINGTTQGIIGLGVSINAGGEVKINNGVLNGQFSYIDCQYKVLLSLVGDITAIDQFNWVLEDVCTDAFLPAINYHAGVGIQIPALQGFNLVNPTIVNTGEDFIALTTNLTF